MEQQEKAGFRSYLSRKFWMLAEWMKPDPADSPLLQVIKLFFKGIALLVLIALSPVILVILVFVFFAAM